MTTKTITLPDLTKPRLLLRNSTRAGDSVAVLTLRAWVEQRFGPKTWYLENESSALAALSRLAPGNPQWLPAESAPDDVEEFDEINLWLWNDVFHQQGFRIDFEPRPTPRFPIIFAPLLEVDYGPERAMHIRFALALAEHLRLRSPGEAYVLMTPTVNAHDLREFRTIGLPMLWIASWEGVAAYVGNADLLIAGDTGISHIGACYRNLRQVTLHSREKTEHHNETEFDHQRAAREKIAALSGLEARYRATPNKREGSVELFFDHGGMDQATLNATIRAIEELR